MYLYLDIDGVLNFRHEPYPDELKQKKTNALETPSVYAPFS